MLAFIDFMLGNTSSVAMLEDGQDDEDSDDSLMNSRVFSSFVKSDANGNLN